RSVLPSGLEPRYRDDDIRQIAPAIRQLTIKILQTESAPGQTIPGRPSSSGYRPAPSPSPSWDDAATADDGDLAFQLRTTAARLMSAPSLRDVQTLGGTGGHRFWRGRGVTCQFCRS